MGTIKGRVIEIGKDSLILLTPEGEFLERPIPSKDVQVGDEISVAVPSRLSSLSQFVPYAAVAALLVFLLVQSVVTMASPAFYLHLDINPSIELGVSKNLRVVEATPLNEDGKKVLDEVHIIDQSVQSAVRTIVRAAGEMKYITPEEEATVLISVVSLRKDTQEQEKRLTKQVERAAREELKAEGKTKATLGVAVVEKEKRQEALQHHSSINKWIKEQQAKEGKKINPEIYRFFKVIPHPDENRPWTRDYKKHDSAEKPDHPSSNKGIQPYGTIKSKSKDYKRPVTRDSEKYEDARERMKDAWQKRLLEMKLQVPDKSYDKSGDHSSKKRDYKKDSRDDDTSDNKSYERHWNNKIHSEQKKTTQIPQEREKSDYRKQNEYWNKYNKYNKYNEKNRRD